MGKKNILLIIESSETGGAENVFAELALRIDKSFFTPHVILLQRGWLYDRLVAGGLEPHIIPTRKGGFDFKLLLGIRRFLYEHKIHLIHSHLFTTNVYSCAASILTGVPVISTFHGTMDVDLTDYLKRVKWFVINRFSRKTIYVSKYLRNFFISRKLTHIKKSCVLYNGIDVDHFARGVTMSVSRQKFNLSPSDFVIGCVGDLRSAKDYPTALRAVALLKSTIPDIKLVIAGTKTNLLEKLQSLSSSLGIDECVHFLGFQDDIRSIFPAFNVYLSSSTSEGFSLTVVEAMVAGVPVIATRSGGPEEIIIHEKTGLLVDVGLSEQIAASINRLYRDPLFAQTLAEAGSLYSRNYFSIESMISKYDSLYKETVF